VRADGLSHMRQTPGVQSRPGPHPAWRSLTGRLWGPALMPGSAPHGL